jgi:hypothetical protein
MESLVELIFGIAAVSMALGLRVRGTRIRFVLAFGGTLLAAVGLALFVVIAYPRETLLGFGVGSMITAAGWGYAHITPWRAHRGTRRWTARMPRSS